VDNLKPFDPQDIDASLVRLVSFGSKRYALFPFVDATGSLPEFRSVCLPIAQSNVSASELAELAALAKRRGEHAVWFIQFSTPWLVGNAEADGARQRAPVEKRNR
jgi:hypothetical protein